MASQLRCTVTVASKHHDGQLQSASKRRPTAAAATATSPPGAKAYFGDPRDDDDEWQYDLPTDSYHAAPTFQPPGHTPRRYGNTHDGGGREAQENWASAGEDHRCTHDGCTHYH